MTGALVPGSAAAATGVGFSADPLAIQVPPYLVAGDTIGITAPAGYVKPEDMTGTIAQLKAWGFRVKMGSTIGKRFFSLAGTDDERRTDLQQMLDDRDVKAIFCARGGYGSVRIVEALDWSAFKRHPKWIVGFSDITVLHSHVNRRLQVASIHSKMGNAFPSEPSTEPIYKDTADSIRKALVGDTITYPVPYNIHNRPGTGSGQLVGGNLKTLESLAGSSSDLSTAGKILFVEDVGEYAYSVDRMFWNLLQSGKLDKLAGLIIGGFRLKPSEDTDEEFGLDLYAIVQEKIAKFGYPVCFDFPVGHQKNNFALKCGLRHQFTVTKDAVTLIERP